MELNNAPKTVKLRVAKETPIKDLTEVQLRKAFRHTQKRILRLHKAMCELDELQEELELEAEKRGLELEDIDNEFTSNNRQLKG